jgi:hypothetical protein
MTHLTEYFMENPVILTFSIYLLALLGVYGIIGIYRNING